MIGIYVGVNIRTVVDSVVCFITILEMFFFLTDFNQVQ